tara:strand:+ start:1021 stop:1233 length:213 start_codon:yes stop_codon:yes gene_type:complete
MNSRIYPEDFLIEEMKKIEREKNLFVRKVLIEKNNKIQLKTATFFREVSDGALQRMVCLSQGMVDSSIDE